MRTPQNAKMVVTIPARLALACAKRPERAAWLARLPGTLRKLQHRWLLTIGMPFDGEDVTGSWVAPVTLAGGATAVLKS